MSEVSGRIKMMTIMMMVTKMIVMAIIMTMTIMVVTKVLNIDIRQLHMTVTLMLNNDDD